MKLNIHRAFLKNLDLRQKEFLLFIIFTWSSLMMAFAAARSVRHDYSSYLKQWDLVLNGMDPWAPLEMTWETNIYGPLHNIFAILLPLSPVAPKIFWCLTFIIVNYFLFIKLIRSEINYKHIIIYLLTIPFNFLVISICFSYGNNDTIVAALIGFATLARFQNKLFKVGIFLGLAALIKYYPLLMAIFFTLNYKKINYKPIIGCVATIFLGLIINVMIYGNSFLSAIKYGDSRPTKFFSVLHSLEQNFPKNGNYFKFLIQYNSIFVIFSCLIIYIVAYRRNLNWAETSAVGTLLFLVTFKASSPQYFISLLFLIIALIINNTDRSIHLATLFTPLMIVISLFQFGYEFVTDKYNLIGSEVRNYIGFIIFITSIFVIINFFRTTYNKYSGAGKIS